MPSTFTSHVLPSCIPSLAGGRTILALALTASPLACASDSGRDADELPSGAVTKGDHMGKEEGKGDEIPPSCHADALEALGYAVEWHEATLWADRDPAAVVDTIIIHKTEGTTFQGGIDTFTSTSAEGSAHYLVGPRGEIACLVPTAHDADQVSNAEYEERAIGIEVVGQSANDDITPEQMDALVALVDVLVDAHGITPDREHIIGHIEVPKEEDAITRGETYEDGCGGNSGHWDPGPYFDYQSLMEGIGAPSDHAQNPDREQRMSWEVLPPTEDIVLAPGEERTITVTLVNTGWGTWERNMFRLVPHDPETRMYRASTWRVDAASGAVELIPTLGAGGTEQCRGPLREVTVTFAIKAPEDPGCDATERCIHALSFHALAMVRPSDWWAYTHDVLSLEVEIAQQ